MLHTAHKASMRCAAWWRGARWALLLVLGVALVPSGLAAQQPDRQEPAQQQSTAERSAMERRLRERLASRVKRELRLSDAQAEKLLATNHRIDRLRRPLLQRERTLRSDLRTQLKRGDGADERTVGSLLDGLLLVHRQRMDLVDAEQRELAQFLTPVQRARYFSLQENWRRQVEAQAAQDHGGGDRRSTGTRDKPSSDRDRR